MAAKQLSTSRVAGIVATIIAISSIGVAAFGATSTFVQVTGTSGTWNSASSWADGDLTPVPTTGGGHIPNGVGDTAIFQELVSTNGGNVNISLGSTTITLSSMTTRNTSNEFTTQLQTGTLVFDNGASPAQFTEALGSGSTSTSRTRFALPVQLNSDFIVQQDHNLTRNTST